MAKIVLLEEQPFSFSYDEEMGTWFYNAFESPPILTVGEPYQVVWDGETHTCVAQDINALMSGFVAIGNLSEWGLEGNDEPFIIGSNSSTPLATFIALNDTEPSTHTVGVYQTETDEPEEPVGIVLKDYLGGEQTYEGVEKVKFNTSDGGTQIFSKGDTVEDVLIDLDFTEGDQTINAPEGYLVKSAIIRKPENLKPENIVKDVDIAGIVGTNEGGGGSSEPRMEYTYNDNGEIIAAKGIGLTSIPKNTLYTVKTLEIVDFSECPNLTTIPSMTCYGCSKLTEIILPASLTSIGSSAFTECSKIATIRFLGTLSNWISMSRASNFVNSSATVYINGIAMTDLSEITIPSDVTQIGDYAFYNCRKLESVAIPDSVTSIGDWAFGYCTSLTSVVIPDGVTSIDNNAFYGCKSITSIVIPDSVTVVGGSAFTKCSSLVDITFGSGITKMSSGVLSYCDNISSITFKDGMTVIGEGLLQYSTDSSAGMSKLTSIVIPASVKTIGKNAFKMAKKLTSAVFEDTDGWYYTSSQGATSGTNISSTTLASPETAAKNLYNTYYNYWLYDGS